MSTNTPPSDIRTLVEKLYGFQKAGVRFLATIPRGILGDDMGLGKTVQTAVSMQINYRQKEVIVCPSSAIAVWERELKVWYPGRRVITIRGDLATRRLQLLAYRRQINDGLDPILIMSYETFIINFDDLKMVSFSSGRITFDEAHNLKNRASKRAISAIKFAKSNAKLEIKFLTGTPLLNMPEELWVMLHMIDPKKYSSFWRWAETYLVVTLERVSQNLRIPMQRVVKGPRDARQMHEMLKPYLLRRTKEEELDLPERTFIDIEVDLADEQLRVYNGLKKDLWALLESGHEIAAPERMTLITRLKQICISLDLLEPTAGDNIRGVKIDALLELLENAGDQKVVIFSQFATVAKRIKLLLGSKATGFTGEDDDRVRAAAVKAFQENEDVRYFCTTTKAGGVAITLTRASIAVLVDRLWTPGYDNQAIDRIYRIGQTRPVTVYSLHARNTLETWILQKQEYKTALSDGIVDGDELAFEYLKYFAGTP